MSLATSIIIGRLVFGTGMGFRGFSKPAKYEDTVCVHVYNDSYSTYAYIRHWRRLCGDRYEQRNPMDIDI